MQRLDKGWGSDLHWSVACLLEIQSGSVPKSAISFFSNVVALSGSLALETCVIYWRTFAWWLGTLNLLSCSFWTNYRSFEYSKLAKRIRIFHWSGPNGARKEIQERGLDSHKLMDCLVALFCSLFSPQTSIPEPVAANQYYSKSIMKSQRVFCFLLFTFG